MAKQNTEEQQQILEEFRDGVNMTPRELEAWLETEESKSVGWTHEGESEAVGHKMGGHILDILHKKKAEYTDEDYDHMKKVNGYIARHAAQKPEKEEIETSNWRYSLKNWGHDPLKKD